MPPFTGYLIASAAAILAVILAIYAWRRRDVAGALAFAGLIAALLEWVIASTFSLYVPGLEGKLAWVKLSYLGTAGAILAWLTFSLQYTGQGKWLNRWKALGLSAIPIITILLVYTNDYHRFVWTRVWFDQYVRVAHGTWYWVYIAYSYLLYLFGMGLLVRFYLLSAKPYRSQAIMVIFGGLIIWVWDILYLIKLPLTLNPASSFAIVFISALVFGWGLFRYRLLDIVPIAREAVIESMGDGMVVLDAQERIIDFNPPAKKILGCPGSGCIGLPIEQVLPAWKQHHPDLNPQEHFRAEFTLAKEGQHIYHEMSSSPLKDRQGRTRGRLVLITDINERKRVEIAEREQRTLAEALRDTASALNSTLELDEVLDRILTNVGRVVPSDAVNIMLIQNGLAHIVRSQGYKEQYLEQPQQLDIKEIRNLREMVKTGQPMLIANVKKYPGWSDLPHTSWICSYVGVPIRCRGETVGFINLDSATPDYFTAIHGERLQAFADQAAVALENARLYKEVHQLAITDSLTGVYNRRFLVEPGRREVDISIRLNHPLSAIMVDIDNFKQVNDTYGHITGDQILCALVKYLRENVRGIDIIGRYGGDEFLILLLESDFQTAMRIAERLRRTISRALLLTERGSISIKVSLGVAAIGSGVETLEELIACADQALLQAKQVGRNRVGSWYAV